MRARLGLAAGRSAATARLTTAAARLTAAAASAGFPLGVLSRGTGA